MRTQSPDTHPEAEKVQIEILRRMGATRRSQLTLSLTRAALRMSRAAVARACPDLGPDELKVKLVELNYGRDLAMRVAETLARRSR